VLVLRIKGLVSTSLLISPARRASSGKDPRSCRATGIGPVMREAVLGSLGRVSIALVMISPMVDDLRRKLMISLRRKDVKG
jgi:hypothetical protein